MTGHLNYVQRRTSNVQRPPEVERPMSKVQRPLKSDVERLMSNVSRKSSSSFGERLMETGIFRLRTLDMDVGHWTFRLR